MKKVILLTGSLSVSHPVRHRFVEGDEANISDDLADALVKNGDAYYVDDGHNPHVQGVDEVPEWLRSQRKAVQFSLVSAGIHTPQDAVDYGFDGLIALEGIGESTAGKILKAAVKHGAVTDGSDEE